MGAAETSRQAPATLSLAVLYRGPYERLFGPVHKLRFSMKRARGVASGISDMTAWRSWASWLFSGDCVLLCKAGPVSLRVTSCLPLFVTSLVVFCGRSFVFLQLVFSRVTAYHAACSSFLCCVFLLSSPLYLVHFLDSEGLACVSSMLRICVSRFCFCPRGRDSLPVLEAAVLRGPFPLPLICSALALSLS